MSASTRFKVNATNVVHEAIAGEVVIVNLKSGSYYSLDKVGADVWEGIVAGGSVGQIAEGIAHRYESAGADIGRAVSQLVNELVQEELLVPLTSEEVQPLPDAGPASRPDEAAGKGMYEPPVLQKYTDMQDLLLLDPIHDVDDTGWPNVRSDQT
jgi:hypothetical protein